MNCVLPILWWAHRVGVIWKPFLLVLSPSSHFNLSAAPHHLLLPRRPRSLGKPEFSDRAPCTPAQHGTQAHPCSAPIARKNSMGLETNISKLYIIHGSCPGCHIKWRSIMQPAHSEEESRRSVGKEKNILISYYINDNKFVCSFLHGDLPELWWCNCLSLVPLLLV